MGLNMRFNSHHLPWKCCLQSRIGKSRKKLRDRIDQLKTDPEKQGKALVDNLSGFRSIRAVGQRYRIIYKVEQEQVLVLVVGVGRRKDGDKKDIYTLLEKLLGDSSS
jgi:mRNA interferase RelE/StbE